MTAVGPRELVREPARRVALRGRLLAPWRRRRFQHFGKGSMVDRPAWLYGTHRISIGEGCMILRGAWLSVERQAWRSPEAVLVMGDGVAMRPNCTVSAADSVRIEDHVVFGTQCSVVDSDHTHGPTAEHARHGLHECVLYQPAETAPIRIGRGTWLGDRVTVLKGADIGCHCTIGANSVVRGTIPDYSVAVGVPARVVGTTRTD